eukprot:4746248-Prymnesium_polylepis.1
MPPRRSRMAVPSCAPPSSCTSARIASPKTSHPASREATALRSARCGCDAAGGGGCGCGGGVV